MYARRTYIDHAIEGSMYTLIPIVMVLVEGGPSSIRTICEALESNTPVVVVKVKKKKIYDYINILYFI